MANPGCNLYSVSRAQLLMFPLPITGSSEENGIVFKYHRKITLAEKFEQIQFTLLFPTFDVKIDNVISDTAQRMDMFPKQPDKQLDCSNFTATNFTSAW